MFSWFNHGHREERTGHGNYIEDRFAAIEAQLNRMRLQIRDEVRTLTARVSELEDVLSCQDAYNAAQFEAIDDAIDALEARLP
jgi:predicted nuclease with TOPRIM domain